MKAVNAVMHNIFLVFLQSNNFWQITTKKPNDLLSYDKGITSVFKALFLFNFTIIY